MLLKGKTAIITGSTRGIGKSTALSFSKEGACVVVNGTDEKRVSEVVKLIQSKGGEAVGVTASVAKMSTGQQLVDTAVRTFGGVDILVNNAGIARDRISYQMTEEEWDDVIAVHLKGTFSCTKPTIVHMKERGTGGTIINLTSTAGIHGTIGQLNYSAAKAGMIAMTKTLAQELSRLNISVNAVAPAALTDMTKPIIEKIKKRAAEKNEPLSDYWKIGTAEEAALFITALASEQCRSISGRIFSVNGDRIGGWQSAEHKLFQNVNKSMGVHDLVKCLLQTV